MLDESYRSTYKEWVIKCEDSPENDRRRDLISAKLGVGEVLAQLLINRGYKTAEEAGAFLRMEKEMLANPFIMADMDAAVSRINRAVVSGEKIAVYGDYDVDGVTSVCTLYLYLKSKGADVRYYIPNRIGDGYGVSEGAVDMLASQGISLIITVDNGITANNEIEYARGLGVDFVVTDHHECRAELPKAVAVVNPHRPDCEYPFKDLAGVGVVFKLISAYEEKYTDKTRLQALSDVCDEYADLIAIGTIADVMPIREENKLIVSYGLAKIKETKRIGLAALMESHGNKDTVVLSAKSKKPTGKITSGYIGYTISPRLNAAGRMRSASLAVELFLTKDRKEAKRLADELCEANRERQEQENRIMHEAYDRIPADYDAEKYPVIVIDSDDWHHGVIGIVSSRITEKYGLPSILISFDGNDPIHPLDTDIGKGSGRSIKGLNLVDALTYAQDTLVKFGGHELAAGLSVTRGNLDAFREKINEYARAALAENNFVPTLEADMVLTRSDLNMETANQIGLLEPFGTDNPQPVFIVKDAEIAEITPVSSGKHARMSLMIGGSVFCAMYFSHSPASLDFYVGDRADVMFTLDINEWNGRKSLQLLVKDIHRSEAEFESLENGRRKFDRIWNGEQYGADDDVLPVREDFVAVYNMVRQSIRMGIPVLTHRQMLSKLRTSYRGRIDYVKLKFIIRIFQELNLLGIVEEEEEVYRFSLKFSVSKTDLDKSNLLRRLRQQQVKVNI